jgi:hypothetical protein
MENRGEIKFVKKLQKCSKQNLLKEGNHLVYFRDLKSLNNRQMTPL